MVISMKKYREDNVDSDLSVAVPILFAFLPDKAQQTYEDVFKIVSKLTKEKFQPKHINIGEYNRDV